MRFFSLFRRSSLEFSGKQLSDLEKRLGYRFKNLSYLEQALRHRSSLQKDNLNPGEANELMEFLGDAVLGLVTAEYLYRQYPEENEGKLTQLKSLVVSGQALSQCAKEMALGDFIIMGSGEIRNGGRYRPTILEDAFEALVGAIYLDGGLRPARQFIENNLLTHLEEWAEQKDFQNYKSFFLEWAQSKGYPQPFYKVAAETGPEHNKMFTIEVSLKEEVLGIGKGKSKKLAEQRAARAAMEKMRLLKKNV